MTRQDLTRLSHVGKIGRLVRFAVPGIVFYASFQFAACTGGKPPADHNCPTGGTGGAGGTTAMAGSAGATTSSNSTSSSSSSTLLTTSTDEGASSEDNTFDHFNDPGDPFDILKQHAEEGPPEIRGRLHSCSKLPYSTLGELLRSRGVNIDNPANQMPKSAGQIYAEGKDSLGVANYNARQAEAAFHTTAGATKLFDIFVQAAPEVIANIANVPACQIAGVGKPMFDATTGECVPEALSCLIGRPAKPQDVKLCNTMLQHAKAGNQADLDTKRKITVAAFLSAAFTCE